MTAPDSEPPKLGPRPAEVPWRRRRVIIKGQDNSRWTDVYHTVLTAPWSLFFLGLAAVFVLINAAFATLYLLDPHGVEHASSFWDAFLFSVQTFGAINESAYVPKTVYANVVVSIETFFAILNLALITGVMYARFSRPFARVVFSRVAIVAPFDGVPTLMFRTANQRGNQIMDASVTVSLASQRTTKEGEVMRRLDELKLVRPRSPLFALSWTVMHQLDETSPLHGATAQSLRDAEAELIILLSGRDETLADVIYARHAYLPEHIVWNHRFVDVLDITPQGHRVVNLHRFHDTEPLKPK
jgi:inward rectifier potassium channel